MKLSVFSEYPGTADGIYKLKAKGCIAATLHWADADGALDGWSAFACLPVDAYGNGSFRYQGGRNIPPGTSHILARAVTADFGQVQEQLFPLPTSVGKESQLLCHSSDPGAGYRFCVMSDLHLTNETRARMLSRVFRRADDVDALFLTGDLVNATSVSAGSIKIDGAVTGAGADITATKDAATYADGNIEIGKALGAKDAAVGTVTADGFIKLDGDVYAGDMTANGGKIEFFGTTFVAEDVKAKAFYGSSASDSTVTIKSGAFEYIDLKNATLSFTEALTITGMAEDDGDSIDVKSLKGKVGAISVVGNIRVQDGSIQAESIDAANIYSAGLDITVDGAITLVSGEASGNIQCASVSATEINNAYRIEATNGDITVGELGGALEGSVPYLKNGGKLTAASTIMAITDRMIFFFFIFRYVCFSVRMLLFRLYRN